LFNLEDDPGEFENLAGRQGYGDVERELAELLHTVVDPEEVSAAAFADQRRRLETALSRLDDPRVYHDFVRRLGSEFAASLKPSRS